MRIFWKKGDELNARGPSRDGTRMIQVLCTANEDGSNGDRRMISVTLQDGKTARIPAKYVWMVKSPK